VKTFCDSIMAPTALWFMVKKKLWRMKPFFLIPLGVIAFVTTVEIGNLSPTFAMTGCRQNVNNVVTYSNYCWGGSNGDKHDGSKDKQCKCPNPDRDPSRTKKCYVVAYPDHNSGVYSCENE